MSIMRVLLKSRFIYNLIFISITKSKPAVLLTKNCASKTIELEHPKNAIIKLNKANFYKFKAKDNSEF